MLHYDEDGRVPLGLWVLRNPFVEFLVPGEEGQFFVNAPWLCVDGVTTMFARALLDDRVRRRR